MTKSIYTFGKDILEVDVSSWFDKYSIRLNDKEIRKGKIEARNCRSHIHEINIGDRIFRIRFIADIFGIMSPVVEPITGTIVPTSITGTIDSGSEREERKESRVIDSYDDRKRKNHETNWVPTIIIVAIVIGGIWLYQQIGQRDAFQNVQIDVYDIGIRGISLRGVDLSIGLNMYNPNSRITATLDRIDYSLYGNGNYVGQGTINQRIDIPPGNTRSVTTSLYISYEGVSSVIWSAIERGNVNWGMKGVAHFDIPGIGSYPINFER